MAPRFQVLLNVSATWTPERYRQMTPTAPPAPVAWRLLGSNHRELGRSTEVFPEVEGCLAAIEALCAAMPDVRSAVTADWSAGLWSWRIGDDTVPLVVSSRFYQRRRESAQSLLRTLENIQLATGEPEVLRSRPVGRAHEAAPALPTRHPRRVIDLRERSFEPTGRPRPERTPPA